MAVTTGGRSTSKPPRSAWRRFLGMRESGVFLVLASMYVAMWFVSPVFRARFNQVSILSQMAVFAVLAIGQTMVIVSGGFDLSQGPIAALAGMLGGLAIKNWGWSPLAGIGFGLAIGLACGCGKRLVDRGVGLVGAEPLTRVGLDVAQPQGSCLLDGLEKREAVETIGLAAQPPADLLSVGGSLGRFSGQGTHRASQP